MLNLLMIFTCNRIGHIARYCVSGVRRDEHDNKQDESSDTITKKSKEITSETHSGVTTDSVKNVCSIDNTE